MDDRVSNRDRSEGWKHAKLSGHENEELLKKQLYDDADEQNFFLSSIGKPSNTIVKIEIGGLGEHDVDCVFGGEKTKSKTDMKVYLDDGTTYNISIKKSLGGQAYLISPERFIRGLETQYNLTIPNDIIYAISLFWGTSDEIDEILSSYGVEIVYEKRKHRLVGDTLKKYNKDLYDKLINWFQENAAIITDFCLSKGLAKNKDDWADAIWYKNELGENKVDTIVLIQDICEMVTYVAEQETMYGSKNGGTTIQLPFGFVQWHSPTKKIPGDMQFHHNYEKISNLMELKSKK